MKRTKVIVTMAAAVAVVLSMMTTAFAAPAAAGTYPAKNLLSQRSGSGLNGSSGIAPSATQCPKANSAQQRWQHQGGSLTGSGTSSSPTAAPTPAATAAPTATPAPAATTAPAATPAPTATAAPTTGATTAPVSGNMSADESMMINLVNQDRASNGGLKPLTFDASLRAGALAHSQDMSQNNYFSHTSPTLGDYATRLKASGVKYSSAGENIAMYASVEEAEAGFMNSAGHRANILGDFTRVGIGIVYNSGKGVYYITQWFAK